ncbi:unnamed protein product [marine sediment metagenome]|uniref:Uncharacterized protein n=1 Tax=marine sediment metagenome TaxID=412755 RepID=X1B0Z9_9ZZZZ
MAADKTITAYFEEDAVPKTGLNVKVYIREVEAGSLIINGSLMTESAVAAGYYDFDFTAALGYYADRNYTYSCDSQAITGKGQYATGGLVCTDAQKLLLAVLIGNRTGMKRLPAGSKQTTFYGLDDTTKRIIVDHDTSGNITSRVIDLS